MRSASWQRGRGKSQDGQLHLEIYITPNLLNKGLGMPRYFKDFKTISGSDESLGIKIKPRTVSSQMALGVLWYFKI